MYTHLANYIELLYILDHYQLIRDRSNAGKEVVKWLWGSLATAPQPTKNKVPILYALEANLTSC